MLKFPYGNADFYKIRTENYFFVDRTGKLPLLEEAGSALLFLRPRRFGKSLWLSVMENYYDVNKADEFESLFGDLAIGNNPTPLHNRYLILKWNFSTVAASDDEAETRQALHNCINGAIEIFQSDYRDVLKYEVARDKNDALSSLLSVLAAVRKIPYKIFLLIDEYDAIANFANEVLMGNLPGSQERYERLIKGEGMLKTVFKAVKDGMEGRGIDRVFITGVSPVAMSDLTSGFNVAEDIYLLPEFNDLCGFREPEIADVLERVGETRGLTAEKTAQALDMVRIFYNGYRFTYAAADRLYNPTLILYFLKALQRDCRYPRRILDANLAMDKAKIAYISQLPQGAPVVAQAMNEGDALVIAELADRFGIEEMLKEHHDRTFMISLLYYFGVLTLAGRRTDYEELILEIPNLAIRRLYVERLHEMMLPTAGDMNEAERAARRLHQKGDIGPLCAFIEQKLFPVFDNRDYLGANELTVKTLFLTLLFNDTFYIMDSEPALERGYGDLIMRVRPDMRHSALLDILIEFKYVPLGKNRLTGQQVREMSREALTALKPVREGLDSAKKQLSQYREALADIYGPDFLKLRTFAVVSVGCERLVWREEG